MAHPDLRLLHALPKRIGASYGEMGRAVFAALPSLDLASQMMRQQLVPVTDAEHGNLGGENPRVDIRTTGLIHTPGPTRNNNPFARTQRRPRYIARLHVRIDAKFAHPSCDQMRILAACVEDSNLRMKIGASEGWLVVFQTVFWTVQGAMRPSAWRQWPSVLPDPALRRRAANPHS